MTCGSPSRARRRSRPRARRPGRSPVRARSPARSGSTQQLSDRPRPAQDDQLRRGVPAGSSRPGAAWAPRGGVKSTSRRRGEAGPHAARRSAAGCGSPGSRAAAARASTATACRAAGSCASATRRSASTASSSRKTRRRYASKAIFIVSNSKRFRISKLRVGSSVKTLRKRLKGERSFKIGRNRWYVVPGKRSRLLFPRARARSARSGWRASRSPPPAAAPCACCAPGTSAARPCAAAGQLLASRRPLSRSHETSRQPEAAPKGTYEARCNPRLS